MPLRFSIGIGSLGEENLTYNLTYNRMDIVRVWPEPSYITSCLWYQESRKFGIWNYPCFVSSSLSQCCPWDYRLYSIRGAVWSWIRISWDLLFDRPLDKTSSPKEYYRDLQTQFEDNHIFAQKWILLETERMKMRFDIKANGHKLHAGDKI